jgi:flagellar protein FlaG
MGIPITTLGSRVSFIPQQEIPQSRGAIRQQQAVRSAAAKKAAAFEQFEASLPGNGEAVDRPALKAAVADLEHISLAFNKKLRFEVDHESNEVTVKVIDGETDKVIKILPPEELQRLHRKIRETIGFLFDERV